MSAAAFIDAIGFASAILTTVGFAQSNLPGGGPQGAEVQIKAGRGDRDSSELGGGITAVYAFDNSNIYLGKSGSGSMGDGGVVSLTIDQTEPGVQADYISVENSDDATCISWVAVNQFDGKGTKGAWLGDIGYACGQPWYYGNQAIDEDGNIKPYCTWLDGNGDPTDKAAMKFRLQPYVGDNAQKTLDEGRQCTETTWGTDKGPISGTPGKRSMKARTEDMENELIISKFPSHTAGNLCDSETSWGPDFVGSDGKLCDMDSKTLSSLCSTEDVDGCVDLDDVEGTVTKRMTVARRSTHVPHKKYSKVSKWE